MNPSPNEIEGIIPCDGSPERKPTEADYGFETLPDYLNDLNAMHEAEKTLTRGQREVYWDELLTLCGEWGMVVAPADRRAKAFLRAIGKWVE